MGDEQGTGRMFSVAGAMGLAGDGAALDDRAFGGGQLRLVAAMLLVDRDRSWSAEQLAAQLWPSGPPRQWHAAVRGLVSQVRRLLDEVGADGEVITARSGHYHVDLADLSVDVEVAHDQVVAATNALDSGRHAEADELAGQARAVLSRPILAGLDAPWVEQLSRQVAQDHLEALLLLGRARRARGRWGAARSVLGEALGLAPLREDAWRALMEVEVTAGNAATALEVYEECRRQLRDELGTDPAPETRALHTRILQGGSIHEAEGGAGSESIHALGDGPGGPVATDGHGDQRSPYVGLRPFQRDDADRFFGRDAAVQRLVDLLRDRRVVTVVGPSGSGKSSLVRAGLLPALAAGAIADSDTWPVAVMVPGSHPLRAMVDALAGLAADTSAGTDGPAAGGDLVDRLSADPLGFHDQVVRLLVTLDADPAARVVLVVDQAEELFTVAEPDHAAAMLAALVAAVRRRGARLAVVVTMRADFYARATTNPDMADLLGRSQLAIPPMSGGELEAAIAGPARLSGVTLEPGIVGRIVDDARDQPGRLPLLQHTLWELWHHRDGARLTVAAYDQVGGIAGGLARHAEQVWAMVDDHALGRRILLRGVSPGEQADTRRPIARADLDGTADTDQVDAVLDHLVSSRLLRAEAGDDGAVFELAHEALISHWPRLSGWVAEQRAHLVTARELGRAADRWVAAGRDPDWLLAGRGLADAVGLVEAVDGDNLDVALSPDERLLVTASRTARELDRARGRAHRVLTRAELALAADPETALLLALAVVGDVTTHVLDRRDDLEHLLRRGLHRHRLVRRHPGVGGLVAVSRDGARFAAGRHDADSSTVTVHRVDNGEPVATLPGHDAPGPPRGCFSPNGRHLVTGDTAGTIRRWELATETLDHAWQGPGGAAVGSLDIASATGLVAAWFVIEHDRQLAVYSRAGELLHEYAPAAARTLGYGQARPGRLVAFHPDGDRLLLAIGDRARRLELLDVGTWKVTMSRSLPKSVTALEWSPDGSRVAVSAGPYSLILDRDLEVLASSATTEDASVTWAPDGQRVITAGPTLSFLEHRPLDKAWSTRPASIVVRPSTWAAGVVRIRGVPRSGHVLIGNDRTRAIDTQDVSITGPPELANLAVGPTMAVGLAWSPDGTRIAVGSEELGVIRLLDTSTWEEIERYRAHPHSRATSLPERDGDLAWAPDGTFIASTANDGTLTIHHLTDRPNLTVRIRHHENLWHGACDITPDSAHVAVALEGIAQVRQSDGTVVASRKLPADAQTGNARFNATGTLLGTTHRSSSPDGRAMATLHLWDWRTDDEPEVLRLESRFGSSMVWDNLSFHPDDRHVAIAAGDEVVRLVDPVDGHVLEELHGHTADTMYVRHHPEGRWLASTALDRTVRVWDLERMAQVARFDSLTGEPGLVRFHPTRPWLAVIDGSGVVRVWTLDLAELVDLARARVTRDLTNDERRALDD